MANADRGNRPLSPHLTIYRPQLTSITSILIRITGNALILSVFLIVCWLFSAATSLEYFIVIDAIMTSWFGSLVLISSLWAVWYHLLGGLRHLIWDMAVGLDLKTAEYLGWAVILGSFLLTFITIVILW
jgi:succinate dehydrogenase / fumarate reductase cytochrome b subunit